MHIIYVSSAMDPESFSQLFCNSAKIPGQQAQKFNRLMIDGLGKNGVKVTALSGVPVTAANCAKKWIPGWTVRLGDVTYRYPCTLNVPKIKNLWQMAAVFFSTLKRSFRSDSAVVYDVLNASVAYGAVLAGRLMRRPCIGVVTDLPQLMVTGTKASHTKLVNKVMEKSTAYVFLTEAMNDKVNPTGKPYVIIEGCCDVNMEQVNCKSATEGDRVCMYAGLLDARYGVKAMVEAFLLADVPGTQLHIYGGGPYATELEEVAKTHPNVIYRGTVMNSEVVAAELEASLLINPRPTREEFTKYSFPSKNLEYMASGTPVLTTKLPGMPEEYYPYVYLFDAETVEGMAQTIKTVLTLPDHSLIQKGRTAKQFAMEKKNNVCQTEKLVEMLKRSK